MSAEDWLPDVDEDEERDEECEVRCKYCRERGLFWVPVNREWVLVDGDGMRHMCKGAAARTDEFDDCSEGDE